MSNINFYNSIQVDGLHVEAGVGRNILAVAADAISLAKVSKMTIFLEFNGTPLKATYESTVDELLAIYGKTREES